MASTTQHTLTFTSGGDPPQPADSTTRAVPSPPTVGQMLSERAAAEVLAARQGIGREQARQLLLSGAAGAGRRVGRSTAYDDDLVHDLAQRPPAALGLLAEWCPQGVHVARIRRGRTFRCDWPWPRQAAALAIQPPMAPMTRALVVHVPIVARGGL